MANFFNRYIKTESSPEIGQPVTNIRPTRRCWSCWKVRLGSKGVGNCNHRSFDIDNCRQMESIVCPCARAGIVSAYDFDEDTPGRELGLEVQMHPNRTSRNISVA
ncbi:uncharacterized protein LOC144829392 isoform X2 [Lissotriton helveticus]